MVYKIIYNVNIGNLTDCITPGFPTAYGILPGDSFQAGEDVIVDFGRYDSKQCVDQGEHDKNYW
jgi:hypothetical protein